MFSYLGGIFMGWSLGASDSSNVFGTAVSSGMIRFRVAACLTAIFVIIGAYFQGEEGILTLQALVHQSQSTAIITTFAAALTVTGMTILKIPVSTSQAVVGAILGIGFLKGDVHLEKLGLVVICWIGTPIGGAFFSVIFYYAFRWVINKFSAGMLVLDSWLRLGFIICGCYGAYALGANNVANVAAVFVGEDMLTPLQAVLLGGFSIAFGALTYSKRLMMTVGKGIVNLDMYSAFISVLAHAVTVHIYSFVGVPVSTSQAIIGAILGISLIKGFHSINFKTLRFICFGWASTPVIAAGVSALAYFVTHLEYTG